MTLRLRGRNITILFSPGMSSLKYIIIVISSLVKNILTQWETKEEKLARLINKKSPNLDSRLRTKIERSFNKLIDEKNVNKKGYW